MIRRSPAVASRRVAAAITFAVTALATSCAALTETTATERQVGDRSALSRSDADASSSRDVESGGGADGDAGSGSGASPRGSRTASLLPPSVSQVWEAGETGLYFTAADGRTEIVAFDLTTGIVLYRVDTHPAGALRGVAPSLYVSEGLEVFLAPVVSERYGDLYADLVAYDLDTGEQMWDAEFPIGGTPLFGCGDEQVCARGDYEQSRYSVLSGRTLSTAEIEGGTIIAAADEHLATIDRERDSQETFRGLLGFGAYGDEQRWSIEAGELAELIGVPLDPGWGWNSDIDPASGVAAMTLANADPDLIGGTVGLDLASGRTAWARSGVSDCLYNFPEERPMIKCVASADDPMLVDRIVRIDPATGDDLWSIAVADPFVPYDVEIVHGTEYLYVWIGEQVLVYDLDNGQPVLSDGPFLCANSLWTYDVDYYPDEDPWEYFADTLVVLCDADGFLLQPLDVAEVLADTDIAGSRRVSFDWELRPFVLDAVPQAMIDGDSGEA
ncbi:MAG: PQQ-like beta-propeller repeat protein [Acidimicrobiia bacterium]|nr:PQQ-like beta-propeller repeat protein [Acidimicrobiia bacterium]MDH5520716.1 PQQ-like beta-propeller repeat protein [Acidimicrobiia bacterium]